MGSPVLTAASVLICAHGTQATPIPGNTRVFVSGVPVLCVGDPVVVAPCNAEAPCLMLKPAASTRVRASGQALATATITPVSVANGLPAMIATTQQRVLLE